MDNYEIAKVLDETADMLEVAGENFFRVRAYRNAARAIRDQTAQVAELSEEQIDEIPGIGADLAGKNRYDCQDRRHAVAPGVNLEVPASAPRTARYSGPGSEAIKASDRPPADSRP